MVLALVFVINMSGAPVEDAVVLSLPTPLANMFLKSGLAMILFMCMIGQLNTQVNASHCNKPPRSGVQNALFWGRVLFSSAFLVFAFVVTLVALFDGKTTMWDGVPAAVDVVLFFVLMSVVGMLEGMQIAFFAVARITEDERNSNPWARWTCGLLFDNGGRGMPASMIGFQLCVVSCFFIIARVTTLSLDDGESNVLGVGDGAQKKLIFWEP
jgi:hypothetical protein